MGAQVQINFVSFYPDPPLKVPSTIADNLIMELWSFHPTWTLYDGRYDR